MASNDNVITSNNVNGIITNKANDDVKMQDEYGLGGSVILPDNFDIKLPAISTEDDDMNIDAIEFQLPEAGPSSPSSLLRLK